MLDNSRHDAHTPPYSSSLVNNVTLRSVLTVRDEILYCSVSDMEIISEWYGGANFATFEKTKTGW